MPRARYCAICGGDHDPDMPCNRSAQVMRDMGVSRKGRRSQRKFRKSVQDANRSLIIITFVSAMIFILILFFAAKC